MKILSHYLRGSMTASNAQNVRFKGQLVQKRRANGKHVPLAFRTEQGLRFALAHDTPELKAMEIGEHYQIRGVEYTTEFMTYIKVQSVKQVTQKKFIQRTGFRFATASLLVLGILSAIGMSQIRVESPADTKQNEKPAAAIETTNKASSTTEILPLTTDTPATPTPVAATKTPTPSTANKPKSTTTVKSDPATQPAGTSAVSNQDAASNQTETSDASSNASPESIAQSKPADGPDATDTSASPTDQQTPADPPAEQ